MKPSQGFPTPKPTANPRTLWVARGASVDAGNEPRGAPPVAIVLVAELCAQQGLFGPNAREDRRDDECREDHAGSRTKGQTPPEHHDDQSQIARVTDDAVNTVGNQLVPGLNGHQTAEAAAEDKDGPDPQRATCHIEKDAKPANDISIENP